MVSEASEHVDVLVIGGGPAGATVSTLLKKYNPDLRSLVLDKAQFPRDHVGESQLPGCGIICNEMGCWDKVEAAGFPIKVGATYFWGKDREAWDYDFVNPDHIPDAPRPHKFEGARRQSAFQVDRAVYDHLLLEHTKEMGVDVRENTQVTTLERDGDRITCAVLEDGSRVTADHYIDATGAPAFLRRTMGVESVAPQELRNIAIWTHWDNARWPVQLPNFATRVQVMSLPYGWIWFIPTSKTRTSIGLIVPAEYYRASGVSPEELYMKAIADEPMLPTLLDGAQRVGGIQTIKDWSHCAERMCGENWFIIGEAAGFADPILAAGMYLAHGSARDCAYTINTIVEGEVDADWLRHRYTTRMKQNIEQYIRFAQFWYAANGCFTDLQDHCAKIAAEGGVSLSPEQAWAWLSQGGFVLEEVVKPAVGNFDVLSASSIIYSFLGQPTTRQIERYNVLKLDLNGAKQDQIGDLENGRITPVPCYKRDNYTLPDFGYYGTVIQILKQTDDILAVVNTINHHSQKLPPAQRDTIMQHYVSVIETMISEGWIKGSRDPNKPVFKLPRYKWEVKESESTS